MSFPRQQARTQRFTLGVPRAFQISPDGQRAAFLRGQHGTDSVTCLWVADLTTGRQDLVVDPNRLNTASQDLPPEERARRERAREMAGGIVVYSVDDDFTRAAFTLSGRLYVTGLGAGAEPPRELPSATPVVDPVISPAGDAVAYVHEGAIRVIDTATGADRVLIEPDGPDVTWGLADFIAAEEMRRMRGMWWAPDGTSLLAARVDNTPVPRWHISDPANPQAPPHTVAYPAAGTANADVRLAVLPATGSGKAEPQWFDWDRETWPYLVNASWSGAHGGERPMVTVQTRDQRRMLVLAMEDGGAAVLLEPQSPYWLDIVPGVPARTEAGELLWVAADADTHRLFADGRPVTPAGLQVRAVVDIDGDTVLLSASTEPTEIELWTYHPDTGTRRVTETGGVHSGRLRGGTLVVQRRSLDIEGVSTEIVRDGETVLGVDSLAESPELPAPRVELIRAGERGLRTAVLLPSWHESGSAKLPVLVDPYGGPHAQRVMAARSAYLTPQWFAEQGFAVVVADGRGSPGRGPEWEFALHRDLAGPPLEDQVAALHDAAERYPDLDLDRVAIRGWSFGGFLAALAVLRRPDVFHAAIAGAPVTDQRLYDTHYTERYLGLPREEPAAYANSSLLADAAKLERPLMLIHGLADDNVVMAHTLRLSSALLAAGRAHTVLPLTGITHMPAQESTAENLLLLQVDFLRKSLAG